MDGAGWHLAKELRIPSNITIIKLPPYSPELNPMEQVFQQLRKLKLSNTCYKDYEEINQACVDAWNTFVLQGENIRKLGIRKWANCCQIIKLNWYNGLLCHDLAGAKYRDCVTTQGAGHSQDIKLIYVTGAPSFLQSFGRRFVKNSNFPIADVDGKPGFGQDTKNFKIAKISEIINASSDLTDLVLIGDNGEYDADVYEEISNRFGHLNITTYIHTLYSLKKNRENRSGKMGHKIYQGQIPYLTAVDLGIDLYAKGLIKKNIFNKVFTKALTISASREEDVYKALIPQWIQCDYFFEIYAGPATRISLPQQLLLKKFNNNVAALCSLND